jgi:hypothetical protein
MVHVDPTRRPTINDVVLRYEKLWRSLPTSHLRSRTQYEQWEDESFPALRHYYRRFSFALRGIAPVPARTAVLPQPQRNESTHSLLHHARRISIQSQTDHPPATSMLAPLRRVDDSSRAPRSETRHPMTSSSAVKGKSPAHPQPSATRYRKNRQKDKDRSLSPPRSQSHKPGEPSTSRTSRSHSHQRSSSQSRAKTQNQAEKPGGRSDSRESRASKTNKVHPQVAALQVAGGSEIPPHLKRHSLPVTESDLSVVQDASLRHTVHRPRATVIPKAF